ncbi:MAG: chain length determinant protein tyrosine kinase EpsG, partial [Methyloversatilis sp.]|nr:chain length determinant protein tyrosine kinase EpsG [Methyloversatilis sp.]
LGLRFGDAAISLGLLKESDIQFALSRQFDYPFLQAGESAVSDEVIAAYRPFTHQVEELRALRSQLMLRWFDAEAERKTLAIVSPERGEGRSFIAANLAVVFSQLGERTLLIDADMRNPRQHTLFSVSNRVGLSETLAGRGGPDAVQRVPALLDLCVMPAGAVPPNPQELLSRPVFSQLLGQLSKDFDVILIDTPAGAEYADAQTIAVRASGALMVARKNVSRASRLRRLADELITASATVVGSVMNEP